MENVERVGRRNGKRVERRREGERCETEKETMSGGKREWRESRE